MANTRISNLTASASNLASTDLAPVVQTVGVGPVKMTGLQLAGGLLGSTTFNGATSAGTALSTVAITGTGGQFSCAAATLAVGQNVTISGTLGGTGSITGYSSPTTYTISATNGSTTFTLVNASTGAALTTTAGTPTGLTYVVTSPVVNFTQTWNNSNVTFTGLKFNATDTASASGSLLLDIGTGGGSYVSRFTVNKTGRVNFTSGAINSPSIMLGTSNVPQAGGLGVYARAGDSYRWTFCDSNSRNLMEIANTGNDVCTLAFTNVGLIGFCSGQAGSSSMDTIIGRGGAAATFRLGDVDAAAPVAQTFKVQSGTAGASALSCSISGTTLTVGGAVTGTIAIGHAVTGTNVSAGTVITAGSGVSWTVNNSQTVSSTTMYFNSVGADFTIRGSQGSGPSAGGSLIFQVAPAGSAATTAQNAYSTALTIDSTRLATFAGGVTTAGNIAMTGSAAWIQGYNNGFYIAPDAFIANQTAYIGFAATNNAASNGADVFLRRDAANTLALRNGTSAQLFRVYSTYNGTNDAYGAIGAAVNLDGTAGDANTLYIGSQKKGSPTALTKLALVVNGTTQLDYNIGASGAWYTPGGFIVNGNIQCNGWHIISAVAANGNGGLYFRPVGGSDYAQIQSPALNTLLIGGATAANFSLLQFGGSTSSFPALKRISSGNCLQVIAADNTASAGFIVGNQALATSATDGFLYVPTCAGTPTGTPTTQTGTAPIVVDTTNNKLYFYSGGAWRDAGP